MAVTFLLAGVVVREVLVPGDIQRTKNPVWNLGTAAR